MGSMIYWTTPILIDSIQNISSNMSRVVFIPFLWNLYAIGRNLISFLRLFFCFFCFCSLFSHGVAFFYLTSFHFILFLFLLHLSIDCSQFLMRAFARFFIICAFLAIFLSDMIHLKFIKYSNSRHVDDTSSSIVQCSCFVMEFSFTHLTKFGFQC